MAIEFKLPDVGEGIAEGEIVKWFVSEGDSVEEHQPVVEVMTDKATVEVPAPRAGRITSLRAQPGDTVQVGEVLFVLEEGEGGAGAPPQREEKGGREAKGKRAEEAAPSERAEPSGGGARESAAPSPSAAAQDGGGRTIEFELPDIGEGIAEGEIVKWLVSEGDSVEEHQPIVEVMTDKATVEVPAPAAGRVTKLLAEAGEVVPIGEVIFHLRTGAAAPRPEQPKAKPPEPAREERRPAPEPARAGAPERRAAAERGNGKVLAVPSARRVARELGVDLGDVEGTGRNGVIRRADVEAYAREGAPAAERRAAAAPPPSVSLEPGERETRTPFRGVRRKIAQAMARSKTTAAHFTVVEELDVTDLVDLRARAKEIGAEQGVRVTYMPFVMKACAAALQRFPQLNSQLDESSNEIVTFGHVNLGIATDTTSGLIVPVIRDVQSKGLLQLARELGELAERTRSGKIGPESLRGGTFTITNAGNIGGTLATPIINFPEAAILGVHRIVKRPGVVETPEGDEIAIRHYMNLSVSVDHRIVDGADAARFLVHMKKLLESPGLIAL